ncbi:hypothetical protein VQ042_15325 [Aurantimonas sp. A2-1-M11]|uniref:hypothetical protein n=1 Tax=Aurantimonas sp. A2-1-M11 TaxID=3113712 RepID=UPI002F9597A9
MLQPIRRQRADAAGGDELGIEPINHLRGRARVAGQHVDIDATMDLLGDVEVAEGETVTATTLAVEAQFGRLQKL